MEVDVALAKDQLTKDQEKWLNSNFDFVRISLCDINSISRGRLMPIKSAIHQIRHGVFFYERKLLRS